MNNTYDCSLDLLGPVFPGQVLKLNLCKPHAWQARSQKILLGSAFEEKVDLLIVQYSPGAVAEFIIVWCMLIAHIHEGLY